MASRSRCAHLLACLALGLPACALELPSWHGAPAEPQDTAELELASYRERSAYLEREVERLQQDLRQAEASLVAIESGLRGAHTRADAVSAIAEARISVERAAKQAPWRRAESAEALDKLAEAERQLASGRAASAVFFATRASRIAEALLAEVRQLERHPAARFVAAPRVNLRAGPSTDAPVLEVLHESTPVLPEREEGEWMLVHTLRGPVGWIHAALLRPR
jgi:SH3-like domain-containing protein